MPLQNLTIEKINDNVYVVTDTGSCNIGVCVSNSAALVIDSGYRPDISVRVISLIEEELNCRIDRLFITHYHADHTFGNQSFGCPILSSQQCLDNMKSCLTTFWRPEEIKKEMAGDPAMAEAWKDLKITFPTETFKSELKLDLNGLNIVFKKVGGHTTDSSVAYLPERKTVFIGDIVFGNMYPTLLTDGDPAELIEVLRDFLDWDIETVVPGHGEHGGKEIIAPLLKYWTCLLDEGSEAHKTGMSREKLIAYLSDRCRIDGIPYVEFRHRRNIESVIYYLANKPV